VSRSDTEIMGEGADLREDQRCLGHSCCALCRRQAARAKREEKPYSKCLSRKTKAGRVTKRTARVDGRDEARAIVVRLQKNFPELELMEGGQVTNLDLLTLIRDCGLSCAPSPRRTSSSGTPTPPSSPPAPWWTRSPAAPSPPSSPSSTGPSAGHNLVDGGLYTLMVKSGTDGQSGRGNFA